MALVVSKYYELQNQQFGTLLNLYGNHSGSTIPNGNKISLYPRTNSDDQKFRAEWYANAVKVTPKRNAGYVLNRHSGDNSVIAWLGASASLADTEIDFMTINAAQNLYRLKLSRRNLYLTATGAQGICYWRALNGSNTQVFKLIDPAAPPATGLGQVFFEGYIRSHSGAGYNLNVYGNNVASANRNVNLWTHTGASSQKWRIQYFNGKLKAFTLVDTGYALNVWRGATNSNNCDITTHSGNDLDSHIVLEAQGSYYRIKLANYNLYLTAAGQYKEANVYWAADSGNNAGQVWALTNSDPTPPPPPPPPPPPGGITMNNILNQYHVDTGWWIQRYGCALCCGIVLAEWKTGGDYDFADFAGTYDTVGNDGYGWTGPDKFIATEEDLTSLTAAQTIARIRELVNAGTPVACHLVGGGEQHWVVAYSATGTGTTWATSGITVLDPFNPDQSDSIGLSHSISTAMSRKNFSAVNVIRKPTLLSV